MPLSRVEVEIFLLSAVYGRRSIKKYYLDLDSTAINIMDKGLLVAAVHEQPLHRPLPRPPILAHLKH